MKKLVVLTGAGISAESGIKTFRDSNGLWEGHDVMDVATPEGWRRNPELVLAFYNQRILNALEALPNTGHTTLADLENDFEVVIITQNVDNLHEKGGSSRVLHLHGELLKVRGQDYPDVYDLDPSRPEIRLGDLCPRGSQLRPHIVWFGEPVPMIEPAIAEVEQADIFMVVGTSLVVYPAAGLLDFVPDTTPIFLVDKQIPAISFRKKEVFTYEGPAGSMMPLVAEKLRTTYL